MRVIALVVLFAVAAFAVDEESGSASGLDPSILDGLNPNAPSSTTTLAPLDPSILDGLNPNAPPTPAPLDPSILDGLNPNAPSSTTTLPPLDPSILDGLNPNAPSTLATLDPSILDGLNPHTPAPGASSPSGPDMNAMLQLLDLMNPFANQGHVGAGVSSQFLSIIAQQNPNGASPAVQAALQAAVDAMNPFVPTMATVPTPRTMDPVAGGIILDGLNPHFKFAPAIKYEVSLLLNKFMNGTASAPEQLRLQELLNNAQPYFPPPSTPENFDLVNFVIAHSTAVLNYTMDQSMARAIAAAFTKVHCTEYDYRTECIDYSSAQAYYQILEQLPFKGPPVARAQTSYTYHLYGQAIVWTLTSESTDVTDGAANGSNVAGVVLIIVGVVAAVLAVALITFRGMKSRTKRRVHDSASSLPIQTTSTKVVQIRAWTDSVDI